jgi:hypothetical protein
MILTKRFWRIKKTNEKAVNEEMFHFFIFGKKDFWEIKVGKCEGFERW